MFFQDISICDIKIRLESEFPVPIHERALSFLSEFSDPDVTYRLIKSEKLSRDMNSIPFSPNFYYAFFEDLDTYFLNYGSKIYLTINKNDQRHPQIIIPESYPYDFDIFKIMGFEVILTQFSAMFLHASLIEWNGKGILFTAPSQTGKSTQASLWNELMGSRTINGDKAIIRNLQNVWKAYGSPWAGTSNIHENESVPISVIAVLKQAKVNRVTRLDPGNAVKHILSGAVLPRWSEQLTEITIQLIEKLIEEIPVVLLECRPDREAVEVLHRFVESLNNA